MSEERAEYVIGNRTSDTEHRLTLADLARELAADNMTRSTIQRYDANKDVQRLLGKEGTSYPASCLPLWKKIAQARRQEPPLVSPETAAIFLQGVMENPEQALTVNRATITPAVQMTPELLERFIAALTIQAKALPAPPDDELLTMKAAHERFGLSYATLRTLRVKDGGVFKIRRSDCLRYIQNLPNR